MTVQAGLCQTCLETTLLVFPRGGSFVLVSILQTTQQKIFLDSLSSCGTANCQEVFLDCMQEGRVDTVEASLFLQKLASSVNASESLLKSLLVSRFTVDFLFK